MPMSKVIFAVREESDITAVANGHWGNIANTITNAQRMHDAYLRTTAPWYFSNKLDFFFHFH